MFNGICKMLKNILFFLIGLVCIVLFFVGSYWFAVALSLLLDGYRIYIFLLLIASPIIFGIGKDVYMFLEDSFNSFKRGNKNEQNNE